MAAMKCPNPVCTFHFDPALVPPGATITCPTCASRFTLAAPQPYDPYAGSPIAPDFQATLPLSAPSVNTPGPIAFASPSQRERAKPAVDRKRTAPAAWKQFLKIGLIAGGLTALVVVPVAALVISKRGAVEDRAKPGTKETAVADKNFAFRMPEAPWKKDVELQSELGVNVVAMTRTEAPNAGMALHVCDYDTRQPLTTELREELHRILNRLFLYIPAELPLEAAKWGRHAAKKALFRGEHKSTGVVNLGEVYILSHKGLAYWFFTWTAEADAAAAAEELGRLRERFRTLDLRDKWSETKSNEQVFRSGKGSGRFRLSTTEPIWTEAAVEATSEDPKAELLLKGKLKARSSNDFAPEATLVALVLPGTDADGALTYLKARWTKDAELFGPTIITELSGESEGDPTDKPAAGLPTVRWKVAVGGPNASKSSEKLVVFTTMPTGADTIVAEGSAPWKEREAWERRLMQFVGTLRP